MLGARQELSQELGTAGEVEHCRVICSGDAREPHICKQIDFSYFKNISMSEECRSHDTARNSLSEKVLRSQAEPLQLGPPANSKEKKQPANPEMSFSGKDHGRRESMRSAAPHYGQVQFPVPKQNAPNSLDTMSWGMGPWLGTHGMGGEVEFPSLS